MAYFLKQDDEFVAAQACDGVDFPHEGTQALGDGDEDDITRRMPVGVVDDLEIVKVQQQQRDQVAAASGQGQRLLRAIAQKSAVGQPGQRIVVSEVAVLFGGIDAIRDVRADAVITGEVAVFVEDRIAADGEPALVCRGQPDLVDEVMEGLA